MSARASRRPAAWTFHEASVSSDWTGPRESSKAYLFCRWPLGVLANRKTCLPRCDGVSVKACQENQRKSRAGQPSREAPFRRRQEVGHGHYSRSKSEAQRKHERHPEKEEIKTRPKSVFENNGEELREKWHFELPKITSTGAAIASLRRE